MELEQQSEEQAPKKGRHRKKLLYNSILQQMEFYFSDSNLSKDRFLSQLTLTDPYVDLTVFLKFNKLRKLTTNTEDIAKALSKSEMLELSEDKTKVKRTTAVKVKENVEECTIYVEKIKADVTHDWLSSTFSEFGSVVYVSIPKYRHNKLNKGFAFVEFRKESEAKQTLEYFESIGCKMSSQMSPEELCSITTYDGDGKITDNEIKVEDGDEDDDAAKKRKRSDDLDDEENNKKLKSESNVENEDDKKKRKSKKMKRKLHFKELGLQILSKYEWKKMRNRYLDMQKKKMKQLKQFLNKKKFSSTRLDDYRQKPDDTQKTEESVDDETHVKLEFVPGVIVHVQLSEPCYELKKSKNELKSHSDQIKYIDFPLPSGSEEVFLRFADNDGAAKFCASGCFGKSRLLDGVEERTYWNKIQEDRSSKFKKDRKKERGRDKLLKKAEKELGKHIRFDDAD